MLARLLKQTALMGAILTASSVATCTSAAPFVPRPTSMNAFYNDDSAHVPEARQVYGKDRQRIRTVISAQGMHKKARHYGEIMEPDGAEQIALRDFRMLKQWHDRYVGGTLIDRDAYKDHAQALLETYGDVAGWGYQEYVDARYEFASSLWDTDAMIKTMDIHNRIGKPWLLGSGVLLGSGTAGMWAFTVKAMVAGSVIAPAAMPVWIPAVSAVGAAGLVVSLAAELRQQYWHRMYGDQYQRMGSLRQMGTEALARLKEHAPHLAEARDKILESVVGYYLDPMNETHTRKALNMCVGADNRYLNSDVYKKSGFAQNNITTLESVISLAVNKAKSGNFSIVLWDKGFSGNQDLSFDLMFCGHKYQFVRGKNRTNGEEVLYRLYAPELLTEMLERLSELSDLTQFHFQVKSVPFYIRMVSFLKSYCVEGLVKQPFDKSEKDEAEAPVGKTLPR
ncbi:hypothetical protein [Sansalvadorimonas verongulae]|uniref:hypothetical protein n=1 Tax=Sansalvadorimonas verongulae TaxID=2172824 RepID=UPI0012BD42F7|nr:hypothetical protein [Sansalvadorimonas verongulae]MTI14754.1 hypothetical protein [Sansalvadorimonas verongulae]